MKNNYCFRIAVNPTNRDNIDIDGNVFEFLTGKQENPHGTKVQIGRNYLETFGNLCNVLTKKKIKFETGDVLFETGSWYFFGKRGERIDHGKLLNVRASQFHESMTACDNQVIQTGNPQ